MSRTRSGLSADNFIREFNTIGPTKLARKYGISERSVYRRRGALEAKTGTIPIPQSGIVVPQIKHPQRLQVEIKTGIAIIGSDFHYWPGPASVAHRAFVKFIHENEPRLVCLNGDVIDAITISRHAPIGWEDRPELWQELEVAEDRLDEIVKACTRKTRKTWNLGNHDARFETKLATDAHQFKKIKGVHLKDHFPLWEPSWSTWINDDVVIKHRFKGGMHAPQNNTLWAGKTIVTGHLHSQKVQPISDYNGTRWGVDTGCVADVHHKAFMDYTEDNPLNWRAGFSVFSFENGVCLPPELVMVWDAHHVAWRGKLVRV
ncbi:MAG: hypothetical protein ACXWCQ_32300 [Burkholderiales bacterium]